MFSSHNRGPQQFKTNTHMSHFCHYNVTLDNNINVTGEQLCCLISLEFWQPRMGYCKGKSEN